MTPLGIGARDVVALARDAQASSAARGPLLVTGVLAPQLARELGAGADYGAVRTDGDPAHAAALVRVVAGGATPEDESVMRQATRHLVPVVAVQTGDPSARLPYVLPTDVVTCEPGRGFPTEEIARTLAVALGREGAALARSLPVLRSAVEGRRAREGAADAGVLAAFGSGPRLAVLALQQSRMLSDLATAGGRPAPSDPRAAAETVGPSLAAALGTGLAARALVRRLPVRNRLLEAAVAAAATYALATVFSRVASR